MLPVGLSKALQTQFAECKSNTDILRVALKNERVFWKLVKRIFEDKNYCNFELMDDLAASYNFTLVELLEESNLRLEKANKVSGESISSFVGLNLQGHEAGLEKTSARIKNLKKSI